MDTPNLFSGLSSEWSTFSQTPMAGACVARCAGAEPALVGFATPADIVRRCHVRGDQAGSNALLAAVVRQARDDDVAVRTVCAIRDGSATGVMGARSGLRRRPRNDAERHLFRVIFR
jgi:hypothetical protein